MNTSILIVDDNMCFVERILMLLREVVDSGNITVASDFNEAERYLKEKPDIILLDINLPGKNGLFLLKKIKQQDIDCTVIMLTNHTDDYYRMQCEELGADYFLDKSNDFSKVPGIISNVVMDEHS